MSKKQIVTVLGKSGSRTVSANIDKFMALLDWYGILFKDDSIIFEPARSERISEHMTDTEGKTLLIYGRIHIKFLPDGKVISRFDIEKEKYRR